MAIKVGLVFGGPSKERVISLNSARTVYDQLHCFKFEFKFYLYYRDPLDNFHQLEPEQLYSNTPDDFYFKLNGNTNDFGKELINACKCDDIDIVFPLIHGAFGEDGELQSLLEDEDIPFIGSPSWSCWRMFDKVCASKVLEINNFTTLPNCYFEKESDITPEKVDIFFEKIKNSAFFDNSSELKVVVKPSGEGSSLGVQTATTAAIAEECAHKIFDEKFGGKAMIEPYCNGREFTIIVIENQEGDPVALIPTEIRLFGGHIFDYRTKYLPSLDVEYHCPPRFNDTAIKQIQKKAEKLFELFEMRDIARMDGWLLKDGSIIFSDFNPISGMEQNSTMFVQGSRVGFTHSEILRYIIINATKRAYKAKYEKMEKEKSQHNPHKTESKKQLDKESESRVQNLSNKMYAELAIQKKPDSKVCVLFGGATSERQISVMSGKNVWLKLLSGPDYDPRPYLYISMDEVWKLPYSFMLNYTVEEIKSNCDNPDNIISRISNNVDEIQNRLGVNFNASIPPRSMSFAQFCEEALNKNAFVFIALHGGEGEDGRLQEILDTPQKLDTRRLHYNGSKFSGSNLCMNKYKTGKKLSGLKPLLGSAPKIPILVTTNKTVDEKLLNYAEKELGISISTHSSDECPTGVILFENHGDLVSSDSIITKTNETVDYIWNYATKVLSIPIIIKPNSDGSSTGVMILYEQRDLDAYLKAVLKGQKVLVRPNKDSADYFLIELPTLKDNKLIFLLEKYYEIAEYKVEYNIIDGKLDYKLKPKPIESKADWIEMTVGVLQDGESFNALVPSITVSKEKLLSKAEKFESGNGLNILLQDESIIDKDKITKIKEIINFAANQLELKGYARIDFLFNKITDEIIVIEANSLPALTPSSVIFNQAYFGEPSDEKSKPGDNKSKLSPHEFLAKIIEAGR